MESDFLNKLERLKSYANEYETITFFEITQVFGPLLFLVFILVCTPFLLLFSTQYVVLPLAAFSMMCAIWYFFDVKVWLFDFLRAQNIRATKVEKAAGNLIRLIDWWNVKTGPQTLFMPYWYAFRILNVSLILVFAFIVGFVMTNAILPVFALIFITLALLLEDTYLSFIGYALGAFFFLL
jgi:hypothetical protein